METSFIKLNRSEADMLIVALASHVSHLRADLKTFKSADEEDRILNEMIAAACLQSKVCDFLGSFLEK